MKFWARDFLGELGYIQTGSTRLWVDNNGAIGQIDACKNMKKARHYLTALSRINEEKVRGTIHVKRIDSTDNVADLFTKALGGILKPKLLVLNTQYYTYHTVLAPMDLT